MLSSDSLPSTTKHEPKTKKLRQRRPLAAEALAHTINEFSARARVSRVTLYRMMNDGQLRFIRLRGRRLIPCSEYARLGLVPAEG